MRLLFRELESFASRNNMVLSRLPNRKYEVYSNTLFVGVECDNLGEVFQEIQEMSHRTPVLDFEELVEIQVSGGHK